MTREDELERQSQLADARLGVAERLGYSIALLAMLAAHLAWGFWLVSISVAVAAYFIGTVPYSRAARRAEDDYFRSAGLGKFHTVAGGTHAKEGD